MAKSPFPAAFVWPWLAAASAGEVAAAMMSGFAQHAAGLDVEPEPSPDKWATHHHIALELSTMRLRDFSIGSESTPTFICAPYALHRSTIADFAPRHSVVAALRHGGHHRLYVSDWRSASPTMRYLSIDSYLAELNVAIDEVGPPVHLVGLCQGGWMSLLYAARFPAKVKSLVLAGAPVDIAAGLSSVSRNARDLPLSAFEEIVHLGGGRVLGSRLLEFWDPARPTDDAVQDILQSKDKRTCEAATQRFRAWYEQTVDLPGTYYLEAVEWVFKENRLANGTFVALGKTVDLATVRCPVYLLAGRDDDVAVPAQVFGTERLIGTPAEHVGKTLEPSGHLGLFMGAHTLKTTWADIAAWMNAA